MQLYKVRQQLYNQWKPLAKNPGYAPVASYVVCHSHALLLVVYIF